MSVRNLERIFCPRRVAVVWESTDRASAGNVVLRHLVGRGFGGVVYPVNPMCEAVEGVAAYAGLDELPATPDVALVCSPAERVPDVVAGCGERGVGGVVILSTGFRESGAAGAALERRTAAAARFAGLRVVGPNSLGFMVPGLRLNASLSAAMPAPGRVALVSRSGALTASIIDWAVVQGIGFSHIVSLGNVLDVDVGDLIDFLGGDAATRAIVLCVESVTDARTFMSAARAFARAKPIVAYKSGWVLVSPAHPRTGATIDEDAVYSAAFERAGIVRVQRIGDVFGSAELLARERLPRGARLAIVTTAGGLFVMPPQAVVGADGELAALSEATVAALDGVLGRSWSRCNPIELPDGVTAQAYGAAVAAALADAGVDAVLAIFTPQAASDPLAAADAVAQARGRSGKPLLAVWMGGRGAQEGLRRLSQAGVAAWSFPEQALGAFGYLVHDERIREVLHETQRAIPFQLALDRPRVREMIVSALDAEGEVLSPRTSRALLEAYEIPVAATPRAASGEEAVALVVSARKDPTFGAVIAVGAGGVAGELCRDRALELPPLNERLARRMLESLRIWPLLAGLADRPPVALDRLIEILMRFSYLVADHPEIARVDVNPLRVAPDDVVALSACVTLDAALVRAPPERFSHLAIRPYPEEYTTAAQLRDGRPVTLRPIKPEDEPGWHAMIAACSEESVRRRFRSLFKCSTHEMAARYCFIDYDREMAIVAELEDGERPLLGVGRLVADPDRRSAEFAILIADPWQGLGLSSPLTEYCLAIARSWGVEEVFAETTPENIRMVAVLRRHGFSVEHDDAEGVIIGRRRNGAVAGQR